MLERRKMKEQTLGYLFCCARRKHRLQGNTFYQIQLLVGAAEMKYMTFESGCWKE